MTTSKKVEFAFEWGATLVLMIGVALTAFNIFPLNVWISLLGNAGWLVVGLMWNKLSLVIIQIVVSAIYVVGLVEFYFRS